MRTRHITSVTETVDKLEAQTLSYDFPTTSSRWRVSDGDCRSQSWIRRTSSIVIFFFTFFRSPSLDSNFSGATTNADAHTNPVKSPLIAHQLTFLVHQTEQMAVNFSTMAVTTLNHPILKHHCDRRNGDDSRYVTHTRTRRQRYLTWISPVSCCRHN